MIVCSYINCVKSDFSFTLFCFINTRSMTFVFVVIALYSVYILMI
eukprot:UN09294